MSKGGDAATVKLDRRSRSGCFFLQSLSYSDCHY